MKIISSRVLLALAGFGALALIAALLALAWPGGNHLKAGKSFRYDISELKLVDPKLMIGKELTPIPAPVTNPHALAVDATNRIYVGGETEIAVLESDGRLVRKLPVDHPVTCLNVALDGSIYVGHRDRIVVLAQDGAFLAGWAPLGSNAVLTSLAVTEEELFAADAGQRLVWRFDRNGRLLGRIGVKDQARDLPGFIIPSPYFDLAVGPDGALWVVDPGRHRLIEFTPAGDPVSSWERSGMDIEGFSGCCNPSHIAIRADGSFVTSEKGLARIKIHTAAGALLGVLAAPGHFTEQTRGIDLAVDSDGRILALDSEKKQVLVFSMENSCKK